MRSKVCVITASGKRVCGTRTTKASGSVKSGKYRITSLAEAARMGAIAGARTAEAHARMIATGSPEFRNEQQIRGMLKTFEGWGKDSAEGHDVLPRLRQSFMSAYAKAFMRTSVDLYRRRPGTSVSSSFLGGEQYGPDHDDDGYASDRENFYAGSGRVRASGAAASKYIVTVTQKGNHVMSQYPAMSLTEARGIVKRHARILGKHLREATAWERDAQGNTKSVFAISR